MAEENASKRRHVTELDGVRGLAILAVMALHFVCGMVTPEHLVERLAHKATSYGVWGVDLFFVLSGYLITGILHDTKGREQFFRAFYMRRTLRIFPLYYAVLFLLIVLIPTSFALAHAPALLELRDVQGFLWTYLTNVHLAGTGGFTIPYASHFWTLAIEEHFYLFWPFVIAFTSRTTALRVCALLGVFSLVSRIALLESGVNAIAVQVLTFCRFDALTAGAACALLARGPDGAARLGALARRALPFLALGVLFTSAWHALLGTVDAWVLSFRGTFLALFFAAFISLSDSAAGPAWLKAPLRQKWLVGLGKYSYGLYVFHGIVAHVAFERNTLESVTALVGSRPVALFVNALLLSLVSLVIAMLSYELFEARFLELKRWFVVGRPAAALPHPAGAPALSGAAEEDTSAPLPTTTPGS